MRIMRQLMKLKGETFLQWHTVVFLDYDSRDTREPSTQIWRVHSICGILDFQGEVCAGDRTVESLIRRIFRVTRNRWVQTAYSFSGVTPFPHEEACFTHQPRGALGASSQTLCQLYRALASMEEGDLPPKWIPVSQSIHPLWPREATQPKVHRHLSHVSLGASAQAHTSFLQQKWPKLCEVCMSLEMISFACFKSALVCTACSSKFTLQKADSFFHILFT